MRVNGIPDSMTDVLVSRVGGVEGRAEEESEIESGASSAVDDEAEAAGLMMGVWTSLIECSFSCSSTEPT